MSKYNKPPHKDTIYTLVHLLVGASVFFMAYKIIAGLWGATHD